MYSQDVSGNSDKTLKRLQRHLQSTVDQLRFVAAETKFPDTFRTRARILSQYVHHLSNDDLRTTDDNTEIDDSPGYLRNAKLSSTGRKLEAPWKERGWT